MQIVKSDKTVNFNGSSVIESAHFEKTGAVTGNLYVVFHNGSVSGYRNVPETVFDNFAKAPSAGQFYNYYVKNTYSGLSVDQDAQFTGRVVSPEAPANDVKTPAASSKFRVQFVMSGEGNIEIATDDIVEAIEEAERILSQRVQGSGSNITFSVKSVNPV